MGAQPGHATAETGDQGFEEEERVLEGEALGPGHEYPLAVGLHLATIQVKLYGGIQCLEGNLAAVGQRLVAGGGGDLLVGPEAVVAAVARHEVAQPFGGQYIQEGAKRGCGVDTGLVDVREAGFGEDEVVDRSGGLVEGFRGERGKDVQLPLPVVGEFFEVGFEVGLDGSDGDGVTGRRGVGVVTDQGKRHRQDGHQNRDNRPPVPW